MDDSTFDYILVGQGLAGSAVAFQLLKRNKRILVFDRPELNSSSRIAAGLFNPVTGKKLTRTWMADQLFPYLHTFYREVEAQTNATFFFPMPLYRPFLSVEEQNEWMAKSADPLFEPYLEKVFLSSTFRSVQDDFGGLLLKQSGYIDTKTYISAIRNLIRERGAYVEDYFDPHQISVREDTVQYGDYSCKNMIFCNGINQNTWFGWLPVKPLKGETICVHANMDENVIFNRGVYAVPANQDRSEWRVGATYNFQATSGDCTPEARAELELKLGNLLAIQFKWKSQEWGFRPTTPDRRPLLGRHPKHRNLWIFNGLGTKGVSLSPYFSDVLIHSIENGTALDKAVDIERYKSLYSSSPK